MRKRIVRIALALLVLGGVAFAMRDSRIVAYFRFAGRAHVPSVDPDFSNLPKVLPPTGSTLVTLLRGLPHPFEEKDEFRRELWKSPSISVHGYRFYEAPSSVSADVRDSLSAILTGESSFTPYVGPKMCGGYHADFAARFEGEGRPYWILVCFGCSEVLIFSEGKELICELERAVGKRLYAVWQQASPKAEPHARTECSEPGPLVQWNGSRRLRTAAQL